MYSIGTVMKLRPGGYAGYKKAHDEIWPELAELIVVAGVSMAIYKHGDLLFVHGVAATEDDWNSVKGEVVDRWHEFMTEYLQTDQSGKSDVTTLEESFAFGVFKSE
jgi:L-rhamnose mutarotase